MWLQVSLIFLLACALLVVLYIHFKMRKPIEYLVYQVDDKFDTSKPSDPLYQPLNELFKTTDQIKNANLITFSDYALIDNNIEAITKSSSNRAYIYAIHGSDLMANKSILADSFQEANLQKYIADTIVLNNKKELDLKEGRIYFLKKNVQRQEGNLITKDIEYIKTKAAEDGYVVCQELLQNPFLVNDRKINLRVYLLIVCDGRNKPEMYFYNNGFIYYTPSNFETNSIKKDVNITTGYIDRQVYVDNPMTHKELYAFMGHEKSKKLQDNMMEFFREFKQVYVEKFDKLNNDHFRFNIFGVDIAPDENLEVKIMEVNKAPDLSYKDARDSEVKLNMVKDMMNLVGIFDEVGDSSNFLNINNIS